MRTPALVATLLALAISAPAADADAPWSVPAPVPAAAGAPSAIVFTNTGHGMLAAGATGDGVEHGTQLTPVDVAGRLGTARQVAIFGGRLVSFGDDGLALAGQRPAQDAAAAARAPVLLATGTPENGLGTPRALPGTAGQQLFAVAGGADGTIALVTGTSSGRRRRTVWTARRGRTPQRILTIAVGPQARGAAISVGSHGELLVAYEDDHIIYSRHVGLGEGAGPAHRLGTGVQSEIQVRYDPSGRQEVAWMRQRVSEGYAATGAVISYTSAARGHHFTKAVVLGRDDITGTGRYVQLPGLRLVGSGSDSSVLATTVYSGGHFRVQVADLAAGGITRTQVMPTADDDVVLGDLAYARAGGTVALWLSATRGTDPVGPQRLFAAVRPTGAASFGAAEAVSVPVDTTTPQSRDATTVPYAPVAAVDPLSGTAVAGYSSLLQQASVSVRNIAAPGSSG